MRWLALRSYKVRVKWHAVHATDHLAHTLSTHNKTSASGKHLDQERKRGSRKQISISIRKENEDGRGITTNGS